MVRLAHILLRWRTKIDADIPTAVALHAPGTSIHKLTFASSRCCHHRYESSVAVAALERTLTIFTNPRKICRLLFLPLLLFTYLSLEVRIAYACIKLYQTVFEKKTRF